MCSAPRMNQPAAFLLCVMFLALNAPDRALAQEQYDVLRVEWMFTNISSSIDSIANRLEQKIVSVEQNVASLSKECRVVAIPKVPGILLIFHY